jgi:hypothetical protein
MWAVDGILAHWDAYSFHIINNYRVYHDPTTGLFTMMPWGIDQTFQGDLDPGDSGAILVQRCMSEPTCATAYAARVREVLNVFTSLDLGARSVVIHDQIQEAVGRDPRREFSTRDWEQRIGSIPDWVSWRPGRIEEILTARGL